MVTAANLARLAQPARGYAPLLSYAPSIKGMVVCVSGKPIRTVAELRGQTLALSNPQSLVTLRDMQWPADNGLQRERDFKTVNTPTDDSVGSVVVRGDAIAAMFSGGEYRAIPDAVKPQFQILSCASLAWTWRRGFIWAVLPSDSPKRAHAGNCTSLPISGASGAAMSVE